MLDAEQAKQTHPEDTDYTVTLCELFKRDNRA